MYENFFAMFEKTEPPPIFREVNTEENKNTLDLNDMNLNNYPMMITMNYPDTSEISYELDTQNPFTFQTESFKKTNTNSKIKKNELKGPKAFEEAFNAAVKINPEVANYKNFLVKTAKRESNFNSRILNSTGAPYYGYFLMGVREIKATTGLSVEAFRNDPVLQILGAVNLYKMNIKTLKALKVYNLGKEKGYSDDALMAGCWMGGPGGVKKYLLGLGDPSDSHWYKKAGLSGGSSVGKIMNNWRANE